MRKLLRYDCQLVNKNCLKKYSRIVFLSLILLVATLCAGCTSSNMHGEKFTAIVENDLKEVIEGSMLPEAIRYTFEDKTYIIDDEVVIRDLLDLLKKERVNAIDTELLNPKMECITFCGVMRDSNMNSYNGYLNLYDDYYYDGNTYYAFPNIKKLKDLFDKIKENGKRTFYPVDMDEKIRVVTGFWLGDGRDISIYQAADGCYYFHISSSNSDMYSDERIMICSLNIEGGKYVIEGLDEMARDYRYVISKTASGVIYDDMLFQAAMME